MKIVERVKEHHINVIMKTGIYLKLFIHKLITPFLLVPFLFLLPTLLSFPPLLTLFSLSLLVTYVPKHLAKLFPWIFSLLLYKILFPLKLLILCVCHKVVDTRYFEKLELHLAIFPYKEVGIFLILEKGIRKIIQISTGTLNQSIFHNHKPTKVLKAHMIFQQCCVHRRDSACQKAFSYSCFLSPFRNNPYQLKKFMCCLCTKYVLL